MRLVVGATGTGSPDLSLVRLIAKAYDLCERLQQAGTDTLTTIAARDGVSKSYLSRVVRPAWLAPDVVTAILAGRQPEGVITKRLTKDSRLPLEWQQQRELLGFC